MKNEVKKFEVGKTYWAGHNFESYVLVIKERKGKKVTFDVVSKRNIVDDKFNVIGREVYVDKADVRKTVTASEYWGREMIDYKVPYTNNKRVRTFSDNCEVVGGIEGLGAFKEQFLAELKADVKEDEIKIAQNMSDEKLAEKINYYKQVIDSINRQVKHQKVASVDELWIELRMDYAQATACFEVFEKAFNDRVNAVAVEMVDDGSNDDAEEENVTTEYNFDVEEDDDELVDEAEEVSTVEEVQEVMPISTIDTVTAENAIAKFEVGQTYFCFADDEDGYTWKKVYKVTKHTAKMVTFENSDGEILKKKFYVNLSDAETVVISKTSLLTANDVAGENDFLYEKNAARIAKVLNDNLLNVTAYADDKIGRKVFDITMALYAKMLSGDKAEKELAAAGEIHGEEFKQRRLDGEEGVCATYHFNCDSYKEYYADAAAAQWIVQSLGLKWKDCMFHNRIEFPYISVSRNAMKKMLNAFLGLDGKDLDIDGEETAVTIETIPETDGSEEDVEENVAMTIDYNFDDEDDDDELIDAPIEYHIEFEIPAALELVPVTFALERFGEDSANEETKLREEYAAIEKEIAALNEKLAKMHGRRYEVGMKINAIVEPNLNGILQKAKEAFKAAKAQGKSMEIVTPDGNDYYWIECGFGWELVNCYVDLAGEVVIDIDEQEMARYVNWKAGTAAIEGLVAAIERGDEVYTFPTNA